MNLTATSQSKVPSAARLLLVEDEANLGLTLSERLEREGYTLRWVRSKAEAMRALTEEHFDLGLLDVGLPDGSGFDLARTLRKTQNTCALVFLTAFGAADDRLQGLELGAEDYVVKPFHVRELLLRIRNVLRRSDYVRNSLMVGGFSHVVERGSVRMNFGAFRVEVDGASHILTHKECALLKFLVERQGAVVSRDEILDFVWGEDEYPTPRTIDNFVMRFRRIFANTKSGPVIQSVRGVGYQLLWNEDVAS